MTKDNVVGALEQKLAKVLSEIGAISGTIYVRDPFLEDELRLVAMHGVKVPEPMHGFLIPSSAAERLTGDPEDLEEISYFETERPEDMYPPQLQGLVEKNVLFGDFATREGVGSFVRFRHFGQDKSLDAVACFNFEQKDAPKDHEAAMQKFFEEFVEDLGPIRKELAAGDAQLAPEMFRLLSVSQRLADEDLDRERFFTSMLEEALRATETPVHAGFGAVFMVTEEGHRLERVAKAGVSWSQEGRGKEYIIERGDGVVSWVALKRRCLLIPDVADSKWDSIFVDVFEGETRRSSSALAVPLIAGDDLRGVIILEKVVGPDEHQDPFDSAMVRWLWYAANHAALADRLSSMRSRGDALLKIAHEAVTQEEAKPLKDLAESAQETMGASAVDIWGWNERQRKFTDNGRSKHYDTDDAQPREDGWSNYVRMHDCIIWIDQLNESPTPWRWLDGKWTTEFEGQIPDEPHPGLNENLVCELGVPIHLSDGVGGVAWIKFRSHAPLPSARMVATAKSLMSQAGLVMEMSRAREAREMGEYEFSEDVELRQKTLPSRAYQFGCGVTAYGLCEPHGGGLGGDLYVIREVSRTRVACVIADAKGHGRHAAPKGFALWAAVEMSLVDGWSDSFVLSKLYDLGNKCSLEATALSFQIEYEENEDSWLLSSAILGHPALMVFRADGSNVLTLPRDDSLAVGGGIGVQDEVRSVSRARAPEYSPLLPGDIVVAFSDGVIEARHGGEMFSRSGVMKAVLGCDSSDPKEIADAIWVAVQEHCQPAQVDDDVTIVVARIPDPDDENEDFDD